MSESNENKQRSISDVSQEYQQLCTKAGHLQYQIDAFSKDLSLLNSTMRDLNFEAAGLNAKAKAAQNDSAPTIEGEANVA